MYLREDFPLWHHQVVWTRSWGTHSIGSSYRLLWERSYSSHGYSVRNRATVCSGSNIDHLKEIVPPIGSQFGPPPSPEIYLPSSRMSVYAITGPFVQSRRIMRQLLRLSEQLMYTGVSLVPASPDRRGLWEEWTLIVKIPGQNFGVDTVIKGLLLSMNFEEVLISLISCDGQTATQYKWRLKVQAGHSWQI